MLLTLETLLHCLRENLMVQGEQNKTKTHTKWGGEDRTIEEEGEKRRRYEKKRKSRLIEGKNEEGVCKVGAKEYANISQLQMHLVLNSLSKRNQD